MDPDYDKGLDELLHTLRYGKSLDESSIESNCSGSKAKAASEDESSDNHNSKNMIHGYLASNESNDESSEGASETNESGISLKQISSNNVVKKDDNSYDFTNRARNVNQQLNDTTDVFIMDTGGGTNCTVTKRAFYVTDITNKKSSLTGYQDKSEPKLCSIVNALTKATVKGFDHPVIFHVNYATLIDDPDEHESLCVPFSLMAHGIKCDLVPKKYGGNGGLVIENEFLPFEFDGEKLFYNISKPSQEDIDTLRYFELTSLIPHDTSRRSRKKILAGDIPMVEWRKRLAMTPEDVVHRTLEKTTQFYLNCEDDNRDVPQRHFKSRFPGLRYPRLQEGVSTDTFFPSVTSDRGNTCSQFFVGNKTNRWEVFPLRSESYNHNALKDFTRRCGVPLFVKSDNAKSETGSEWTEHCRDQCIEQLYTEPHTPWQNNAEPRIGNLNTMVVRVMKHFKVPLNKHDWAQKWCCDVHNILASREHNWETPLTLSTGYTQDISKFRFYLWEPIWYFVPGIKAPKNNLRKARWLGFAHSSGDNMTYYICTEDDPKWDKHGNK